jgi:hypothetical protein
LKEALFLSIWLRRQEAQVYQTRALVQGLVDIVTSLEGGKSSLGDTFQNYVEAVFPFARQQRKEMDEKMKEALKRETSKGIITFSPMSDKFLERKLKVLQLDEEFKQRMAARKGKR